MLIAREEERGILLDALRKDESQFIAVYGRRRVGKTYLIRETYHDSFTFQHAGFAAGKRKQQLQAFYHSLQEYGLSECKQPDNWMAAFELLKILVRRATAPRKIIFLDELSWMDTPRSDFMVALEGFWNGWVSARRDVVLIVCASATSWMIRKIIHNRGGLYNRLTGRIYLKPFTLGQCEEYLTANHMALPRVQILEGYMILGGIPYYWSYMKPGLSLSQNIDAMFFAEHAPLKEEFAYLFASLFKNPDIYIKIVSALGTKKAGMTREEISKSLKEDANGSLSEKLEDLENCGFIRSYREYGNRKKGTVFQLTDGFVLFHYRFLENPVNDGHYWTNQLNTPARNTWCGLAFERVCLLHVPQIKQKLGITGVLTDVCTWQCRKDPEKGLSGSQIDLLLVRADRVINLCEMKYASDEYTVTAADDRAIRRKVSDFLTATQSRSAIHVTLCTTYGLHESPYAGRIQALITCDDLFAPVQA